MPLSKYPTTPYIRRDVSQASGEQESEESVEEERKSSVEVTPLLFASMKGKKEDVLDKLLIDGVDVNSSQGDGWTALHYSVNSGHQDVINLLAVWGANMNCKTLRSHSTPLHLAAKRGNGSIVEQLIDLGADPHTVDKHGWTPIMLAETCGFDNIVRLLKMKMKLSKAVQALQQGPALQGSATRTRALLSANNVRPVSSSDENSELQPAQSIISARSRLAINSTRSPQRSSSAKGTKLREDSDPTKQHLEALVSRVEEQFERMQQARRQLLAEGPPSGKAKNSRGAAGHESKLDVDKIPARSRKPFAKLNEQNVNLRHQDLKRDPSVPAFVSGNKREKNAITVSCKPGPQRSSEPTQYPLRPNSTPRRTSRRAQPHIILHPRTSPPAVKRRISAGDAVDVPPSVVAEHWKGAGSPATGEPSGAKLRARPASHRIATTASPTEPRASAATGKLLPDLGSAASNANTGAAAAQQAVLVEVEVRAEAPRPPRNHALRKALRGDAAVTVTGRPALGVVGQSLGSGSVSEAPASARLESARASAPVRGAGAAGIGGPGALNLKPPLHGPPPLASAAPPAPPASGTVRVESVAPKASAGRNRNRDGSTHGGEGADSDSTRLRNDSHAAAAAPGPRGGLMAAKRGIPRLAGFRERLAPLQAARHASEAVAGHQQAARMGEGDGGMARRDTVQPQAMARRYRV